MPSLMTVSKIVPTMWNELRRSGPTSRTNSRTRSPGWTWMGWSLYWLATPLKTTKSGAGSVGVRLGVVGDLALRAEVPLALDDGELLADRRQAALRLDDDHAEHAVGDVQQRGRRAAVVHPHAGVVGRERVGPGGAGGDLDHLVVHRRLAGVEVDRVGHGRGLVRWTRTVSPRWTGSSAGDRAAERPDVHDVARRDRHLGSTMGRSMSWTVPGRTAGAIGL